MLSTWLRAVRMRFLLASVISVCLGLVINWWQNKTLNAEFAALTFAGVIALHASVDLLNDYWDNKRQIETQTRRTKFSGGTGVLLEELMNLNRVYMEGLILLFIECYFGRYFIFVR